MASFVIFAAARRRRRRRVRGAPTRVPRPHPSNVYHTLPFFVLRFFFFFRPLGADRKNEGTVVVRAARVATNKGV
jgi:hypothetical protein